MQRRKEENGMPAFAGMTNLLLQLVTKTVTPAKAGVPFGFFFYNHFI